MSDDNRQDTMSKEELIIKAMKLTLIDIIRDTTVAPGIKHPLSEKTIDGIRDCLVLISHREQELAEAAGRPMNAKPYFVDEPRRTAQEVVVPLSTIERKRKERDDGGN